VARTNEDGIRWLDEQMRLLGINRAELARRSGLGRATLTNIASGSRRLGVSTARAIAQGLGVPQDVVLREFGLMDTREDTANAEEAALFTELLDDIDDIDERRKAVGLVTALLRQMAIAHRASIAKRASQIGGKRVSATRRAAASD
jgi:transcriptional regulator with XRE-family HTH domain